MEIIIGLQHFPMAFDMLKYPEFAGLRENASDMIVLLFFCVGIFLVNCGVLSLYFAGKLKTGGKDARVFFLCQGITILFRAAIEIMYPAAVPEPDPALLPLIFLVSLTFLVPVALTAKPGGVVKPIEN